MRWVINATPWPLYPQEIPGDHCKGGWVGPKPGLDGCGKSRLHRESIPGQSSSQPVALPTDTDYRPTHPDINHINYNTSVPYHLLSWIILASSLNTESVHYESPRAWLANSESGCFVLQYLVFGEFLSELHNRSWRSDTEKYLSLPGTPGQTSRRQRMTYGQCN